MDSPRSLRYSAHAPIWRDLDLTGLANFQDGYVVRLRVAFPFLVEDDRVREGSRHRTPTNEPVRCRAKVRYWFDTDLYGGRATLDSSGWMVTQAAALPLTGMFSTIDLGFGLQVAARFAHPFWWIPGIWCGPPQLVRQIRRARPRLFDVYRMRVRLLLPRPDPSEADDGARALVTRIRRRRSAQRHAVITAALNALEREACLAALADHARRTRRRRGRRTTPLPYRYVYPKSADVRRRAALINPFAAAPARRP